jgi:quercetin dioxygenase-like cupin family protein
MSLIFVDASPGDGPALHRHDYEEVFVLEEGGATFTLGEDEVDASAGDIVVAPAGTPHAFAAGPDGLRMVAIHHSPRFVTEWLDGR